MINERDVEQFLNELHQKLKIGRIIFDHRKKNLDAIASLELAHPDADRKRIISKLTVENYSEGPKKDDYRIAPLWVFGCEYKGREIYIKIQLLSIDTFCISFHEAEYKMSYPFKK